MIHCFSEIRLVRPIRRACYTNERSLEGFNHSKSSLLSFSHSVEALWVCNSRTPKKRRMAVISAACVGRCSWAIKSLKNIAIRLSGVRFIFSSHRQNNEVLSNLLAPLCFLRCFVYSVSGPTWSQVLATVIWDENNKTKPSTISN